MAYFIIINIMNIIMIVLFNIIITINFSLFKNYSKTVQIEVRTVIFLFTQQAILCRFNKLKFANSNRQTLRTLDTLGENRDSYLKQTRERITKENEELHLLKEKIKSLNDVHSSHLAFVSIYCNCSGELSVLMKYVLELEKSPRLCDFI